ncbi:MAG: Membrane protein insertase, YidC/Oxa1 family [Microgenomates group bacterium GW2011_GWA2_37_6]|nr:MAG: Membrane protein insertase, YidC/Oxa1 family [Microgenomates group bacterium GW2011_GWA2_37_6]
MEIFNILIVNPIINVLVAIYQALSFLHIPYPLGFSIIGLTIVIRIILYPLISSQLKASKKMQALVPHLSNVKEKHKGDKKRIQEETMRLYKEHGVNPAAGCLPTLIQLPVIWGLYSVLNNVVQKNSAELVRYINGIVLSPLKLDKAWDPSFFGIPLGQSPSHLMSSIAIVAISIPILTAVFQFVQSKMMFSPGPKTQTKKNDDFASAFQSQATYIFPIMIAFFSFSFPVGLSLYWNTFTIFGIIQQYKIGGLGGLESLWQKTKALQRK